MRVLDLFSGIGGFSLGLERAGMETVAFCEIEDFCYQVLRKHWPDVPIHQDIRQLNGEKYRGTVDVVCGGFPCQPFSQAGQRRGADDDRHLWPEMLRVIREVQPTWVIGENVIGLETMGLEQCVSDLEGNGFSVQVFDIPACGVGAPHRRHRLWIVAHANTALREQPRRIDGTSGAGQVFTRLDGVAGYAAHAGRELLERRRAESAQVTVEWPTEPPVCSADDGIPNRVDRLRALGNAVVPQIVEIIGRGIMKNETALAREQQGR